MRRKSIWTFLALLVVLTSLISPLGAAPAQAGSVQPSVGGEGAVRLEPAPPYREMDSGLWPSLADPLGLGYRSPLRPGPNQPSKSTSAPEPATQTRATDGTYALAWPSLSKPASLPASDLVPSGVPLDMDSERTTYALPTTSLPEAIEPQLGPFLSPPLKPLFDSMSGTLSVEVLAAYNFVVDSNVSSPSTYAPSVATLGARFCNTSTTDTLTSVQGFIGNYNPITPTESTPGIYPVRDSTDAAFIAEHPALDTTGDYSFSHLGGRIGLRDATRYVGTLAPGECKVQYWHITYPQCSNSEAPPCSGVPVWGDSVKPSDDLWLEYDVWATAAEGDIAEVTRKATMRNEISAMANKIYPNGGAWFNTDANTVAPGDVITSNGVRYELGNINKGFDNDGDGDYDYNAWLQPIGDPSHDPSCFRLIRTTGVLTVSRSGGNPDMVITFTDQLYFTDLPSDNTGVIGDVHYTFMALDGPCSTSLTPYQEVASGADNEKFNGDYGTGIPPVSSSEPKVEIDKTGNVTVTPGNIITYTVPFENNGDDPAGLPLANVPLVLSDTIPVSTTFVAGSISYTLDYTNTGITILYSTDYGATWSPTAPVTASDVTNIQWWLNDRLPSGKGGSLTFQITVDPAYNPTGGSSSYVENCADASFGVGVAFDRACAVTLISGTNSIGDWVWKDDDSDGAQDAGESGIANVTVSLYLDKNGDGALDSGDLLVVTTTTDSSGIYTFTNLPNGDFLVQVDSNDSDLPFGYSATTPELHAVTGLGTTITSPYNNADFGFGPVLRIDKKLISGDPAYEGEQVTYTIDLVNTRPGDGTGQGSACTYVTWAATEDAGHSGSGPSDSWTNPSNAFGAGGPDGSYASSAWANALDMLAGTDLGLGVQAGNIVTVEVLFSIYMDGQVSDDEIVAYVWHTDVQSATTTFTSTHLNTFGNGQSNQGILAWDVTSAGGWEWSDFGGTILDIGFYADKSGSSDTTIYMDAMGWRVTSDQMCGGSDDTVATLPLTDTYDASLLQFVSASPAQSSLYTTTSPYANTGVISWTNLGPLYAGQTKVVTLTFTALEPPGNVTTTITNTAMVTNATFGSGRPVNPASDIVTSTLGPSGSIGDFVWRDLNADGVQDGGNEVGIAGVVISLTADVTITIRGVAYAPGSTVTTTTDANGLYLFEGLRYSGNYTVTVDTSTLPVGTGTFTNTYDLDGDDNNQTSFALNPTAAGAGDQLGADFGYTVPTIIDGTIWNDWNQSGTSTPDTGEEGLTGVVVTLTNGIQLTTTTNADGYFSFVGTFTGTYTVTVNTGTGPLATGTWIPSFDSDGLGSPHQSITTVVTGGRGRADFSYYEVGNSTIGDTVYADWNGDGDQDAGEEGINGVTVRLYEDSNGDGVVDPASDALITTTVTVNGIYSFTNVVSGTFIVVVDETTLPTGYNQTQDPDEAGVCSTCNGRGSASVDGTLAGSVDNIDFGYQPTGYGSIGDYVWKDDDRDGIQDAGETGIASIMVSLYEDSDGDGVISTTVDALVMTTTTGITGTYLFSNLAAAGYLVQVDINDTDLPTDTYGSPYVLSTSSNPISVTLATTQTYLLVDFGFTAGGTIGDLVWRDDDKDGTPDTNEPGIANVTVSLYDDVDGDGLYSAITDTLRITTTTNVSGTYLFTSLPAGDYVVVVDTSDPDLPTSEVTGDPDSTLDGQTGVTLSAGQTYLGADFGFAGSGVIGDALWIDLNNDGVYGPGESGIANVVITLTDSVVLTTTTDNDGYYIFPGLISDTYTITVQMSDLPAGLVQTYDPDATLDNRSTTVLTTGNTILTIDFGYAPDLSVTKASSGGGTPVSPGEVITYTIVVSNPSPATVTGVTISDTTPTNTSFVTGSITITPPAAGNPGTPPILVSPLTVSANSLVTITFQVTVTTPLPPSVDTITNTVLLTSMAGITDTDTVTDAVAVPSIELAKTPDSQTVENGQTVTFTITVTNTGGGTLTNVVVSDTLAANCERTIGTLAAGITTTYTCTVTNVTAAFTNTAIVTGTSPSSQVVTDTDSAQVNVLTPAIEVAKTPDSQTVESGTTVTFTITVTNTGGITLTNVTVSDTQAANCERTFPSLAAGITTTYACTVTNVTAAFTNTAIVTGTSPSSQVVTDTDSAQVNVLTPAIEVAKTPDNQTVESGTTVTFTITVTNTGGITLTNVTVSDTLAANCERVIPSLAPGITTTYACTLTNVTAAFTNTAIVTGTSPASQTVTDTDTAQVDVLTPGIAVAKTPDSQTVENGQTVTFTISVTNTGGITLTNVVVSDTLAPNCERSIGTLAAGITTTYACTVTNVTAAFTNTAIVTGTSPASQVVTDTDTANVSVVTPSIAIAKTPDNQTVESGSTVTFTITVTNTGGITLTNVIVSDTLAPNCERSIGTLAAGIITTYACTVTNVTAAFTNTAIVTGTSPASQVVTDTDTAQVILFATVGDYVWSDTDGDGIQDGGETGISGITVTLYTSLGVFVDSTTTDASGLYTFTNVVSGTYYISFTAPAGYVFSPQDQGGNDALDSDANASGRTANFSVSAGETKNDVDAGLYQQTGLEVVKTVQPGEAVRRMPFTYTIYITNTGQVTLNPLALTDTLPADFYYVVGSGSPSDPNPIAEPTLVWQNLGSLNPGDSLTVTFAVTATPSITGTHINVVTATGTTPGGTVTDTDNAPIAIEDPAVVVDKQLADWDSDEVAPNYITFTIVITNVGPSVIDELPLLDQYDTNYLSFVDATPYPEEDADDGLLTWNDLTGPAPNGFNRNLPPGESFLVTTVFTVVQDITTTTNTAIVTDSLDIHANSANEARDDETINNIPTAVDLLYFRVGGITERQVRLEWATAVEVDNFGFNLYRALVADRSQASLVAFIPEQAHGDGATYAYTDTVPSDGVWWYWLADVDTSAKETFHGPQSARVGAGFRSDQIYLPLIMK